MFNFPNEINDLKDVPESYKGLYQPQEGGAGLHLKVRLQRA